MSYLHFPPQLTEEEEMLKKKYQILRKKKKALQMLTAHKQEQPLQSSFEVDPDAKEVAKKFLKLGATSAIEVENKDQGRKPNANDRSDVTGYQPFSASHTADEKSHDPPTVKKLFENFVSAGELAEPEVNEERVVKELERGEDGQPERPHQGNTVYVQGPGITQEILEKTFKSIGNIVDISMEMSKNCGFVTFEKIDDADKAIETMNMVITDGVELIVSLARHQPLIPPVNDKSLSSWACSAANFLKKGGNEDSKRKLVVYDDL